MVISKAELAEKLSKVKLAIPGKDSTMVQGVLVRGNTLTANNHEIGITAAMSAESDATFILSQKAVAMIESLPDGDVEIQASVKGITIRTGSIKNTVSALDAQLFIEFAAAPDAKRNVTVASGTLYDLVSSVLYAAAVSETAHIHTGVLFEAANGTLNVVALDGHRAAWNTAPYDGAFRFVVPRPSLEKMLRLGIEGDISIALGATSAVFTTEQYTVNTRLLTGEFFKYKTGYPRHALKVDARRDDLYEAVRRALVCLDGVRQPLVWELTEDTLTMRIQTGIADYTEAIGITNGPAGSLRIGFNPLYLRDAVKSCEGETVTLEFGSGLEPMVIADGNLRAMVLPVRLSEVK